MDRTVLWVTAEIPHKHSCNTYNSSVGTRTRRVRVVVVFAVVDVVQYGSSNKKHQFRLQPQYLICVPKHS